MDAPDEARVPAWLSSYRVLGQVGEHLCLEIEPRIYVYWLVGHFRRSDLDGLSKFCADASGRGIPYVSISFTERLTRYDADLRTVMTAPGELVERRAAESIVVSNHPLERMVVHTMSLAGRAAGSPGGLLGAAATFEEALARARRVVRT
jgi:hypothetical protein